MKRLLLLFFVALGLSCPVHAAAIWTNPITDTNPSASNPFTTGQLADPNLTVSGIGRGAGISANIGTNRYNANSWNTLALDSTAYFYFTLTPLSGFQINFTDFVYTGQSSTTGPTAFAFRSSLDGFASDIATPNSTGTTISLAGSPFQGITSPIEFRFYGYGASAPGGTFSINDFTFNGAVVATPGSVPESGPALGVFACVLALLAMVRQRLDRRRSSRGL